LKEGKTKIKRRKLLLWHEEINERKSLSENPKEKVSERI
jgi:hypothetical protein